MKHLESSESTQIKSQNDRPSSEIPHERRANSRVTARVSDVEGGTVCSEISTFAIICVLSVSYKDKRVSYNKQTL